jgi:hypothetical protein
MIPMPMNANVSHVDTNVILDGIFFSPIPSPNIVCILPPLDSEMKNPCKFLNVVSMKPTPALNAVSVFYSYESSEHNKEEDVRG